VWSTWRERDREIEREREREREREGGREGGREREGDKVKPWGHAVSGPASIAQPFTRELISPSSKFDPGTYAVGNRTHKSRP
jgi:hypothetical protein